MPGEYHENYILYPKICKEKPPTPAGGFIRSFISAQIRVYDICPSWLTLKLTLKSFVIHNTSVVVNEKETSTYSLKKKNYVP